MDIMDTQKKKKEILYYKIRVKTINNKLNYILIDVKKYFKVL